MGGHPPPSSLLSRDHPLHLPLVVITPPSLGSPLIHKTYRVLIAEEVGGIGDVVPHLALSGDTDLILPDVRELRLGFLYTSVLIHSLSYSSLNAFYWVAT